MRFSDEQNKIFDFKKKKLVVSASAGAGKTTTIIEFISRLIEDGTPVKRMLILTFTKSAASQLKDRLYERLIKNVDKLYIQNQLDDIMTSDISTIHSFLEKIIRKNISSLPQLESFIILDENQTEKLMQEAFDEAQNKLKLINEKDYEFLFFTIRDFKEIRNIVFAMHNYFSAQASRMDLINNLQNNFDLTFKKACDYLNQQIKVKVKNIILKIDDFPVDNQKISDYFSSIKKVLIKMADCQTIQNLFNIDVALPRQPILKNYVKMEEFADLKEDVVSLLKLVAKYRDISPEVWEGKQTKKLTHILYDFYKLFEQVFNSKKIDNNALDFNDLEWQSELLLEDETLLDDVQGNYDYVFIDEYQDTNPVQEKLIKAISEKGKFIAVGDPKQGIYAFRNATSKIILDDSKNFKAKIDSDTFFLTENYRSDKKILEFVNSVFSKIMTEKTANIDYKNSSMFKGKANVETTGACPVRIDIAKKIKPKKFDWPDGYDIFKDELITDDTAKLEAQIVVTRIEEFLTQTFVNAEGVSRKVLPSDIAVLTRGRSDVSEAVMNELRNRKLPFVSTLKTDITQKSYIKLIVALITLCVNFCDDISLTAFLLSPFVKISPDKLAVLRKDSKKELWRDVLATDDNQILNALEKLKNFKNQATIYGAKKALENLFVETNFFAYLFSEFGANAVTDAKAFLNLIANYENDKDLPALVDYLSSGVSISSTTSSDAITISTIHNAKGLEFPIVILIGAGRPMVNPDVASFKINSDYGLALSFYDEVSSQKFASPILLAERDMAKKSEKIDELMVLYVALTRAKSHLVITGTFDSEKVKEYNGGLEKYNSYLSLILATCEDVPVNEFESIENLTINKIDNTAKKVDIKLIKELNNYLNFDYPYQEDTLIKQKTSVTELNSFESDFQNVDPIFSQTGTAYHEALKVLDFEKIKNIEDIKNQLLNKNYDKNMLNLIDFKLILENIKLILPLIKNKKVFKEKQFVLRLKNNQLVQGVIDLFALGEKNVLIDYKFTKEKDENKLKNRYEKQILLYKKALENAENIKINSVYLISLLNKKIIIF